MSSSSTISILLIIFYVVILLFAISDLKQFIFQTHISRVDRVPITIDIDSSTSVLYSIIIGIIFNIFIILFSMINIYILIWKKNLINKLFFSTFILFLLFTIRFIVNIIITKNLNGHSTPTLVQRSFFASSLSLNEELTTITLNWFIKIFICICTFIICYQQKQQQTMSIERRRETQLMSNFE